MIECSPYYNFSMTYCEKSFQKEPKHIRVAKLILDFIQDLNHTDRYFCTCFDDDYIDNWSMRKVQEIAQNSKR